MVTGTYRNDPSYEQQQKIPENILYYEYRYGNKIFQFEIPGEINYGENSYKGIYFPALQEPPVLKSREPNIMLSVGKEEPRGGGFLENLQICSENKRNKERKRWDIIRLSVSIVCVL